MVFAVVTITAVMVYDTQFQVYSSLLHSSILLLCLLCRYCFFDTYDDEFLFPIHKCNLFEVSLLTASNSQIWRFTPGLYQWRDLVGWWEDAGSLLQWRLLELLQISRRLSRYVWMNTFVYMYVYMFMYLEVYGTIYMYTHVIISVRATVDLLNLCCFTLWILKSI